MKRDPHYVRPVPLWKNRATIAFLVVANSFGNLLLALGTKELPPIDFDSIPRFAGALVTDHWILAGVTLLAFWMYAQLSMLSWSDLSYVIPVTASGYILTALLGAFVLNEHVSVRAWIGISVISLGVFLVSETAPHTVHADEKFEEPSRS